MGLFEPLGSRVLAWVGLPLDFALDLGDAPFHRITPHLHPGRRPRPEEIGGLAAAGITDVVSCLPETDHERMAFLDGHLSARFLPVRDGMYQDLTTHFEPFFASVANARDRGGQLFAAGPDSV